MYLIISHFYTITSIYPRATFSKNILTDRVKNICINSKCKFLILSKVPKLFNVSDIYEKMIIEYCKVSL